METNRIERFSKLDGLRGLLSLIVCLNHSFMVVVIPTFANVWQQNPLFFHDLQAKLQQLMMFIGNGGAAVTLFFLLSGFVLGQSYAKIKIDFRGFWGFIVKRMIRLYPVYALIAILTAIYMKTGFSYQTFPDSSAWFNWWMNFEMTIKEFLLNLTFIHTYLGGVTWTLRVILIISFIFPIVYLLNKKTSRWADLFIVGLLVYLSFTLFDFGDDFRDLRYLYMFYLGLMVPKFKNFFSSISNRVAMLLLPGATIILLGFRYLTDQYLGGVVEAIISFMIIGLAAYGSKTTVLNFLDGEFLKFFGKISYSLYLIHFSVLYILSRFMFVYLPNLPYSNHYFLIHVVLFIFSTIMATGVSLLVYRFVELPSHNLSVKAGQKISER
ncbi:MAG TPA: acyltransferase [Candidatus Woesebacteria bacterium]|nr:acyltransferase [Candidatus Woesebacteria bacterium]